MISNNDRNNLFHQQNGHSTRPKRRRHLWMNCMCRQRGKERHLCLTYQESDMIIFFHSNASYLSKPKARSRAGGHFFMSSNVTNPHNNGAVLKISQLIKAVMSLAAEAELSALYINAREAVPLRQLLTEMGHTQPRTPIQTDTSTACGVINSNIQPQRTKAMDMRFHWLRCREAQQQFCFYWAPGKTNLGNYWTKHHCAAHHIEKRPTILTPQSIVTALQVSLHRNPNQLPYRPGFKNHRGLRTTH